jgi:F-type H+-transporting ATPase subunit epsilon
MAGTFKFELVSPERVLLSIDADQVVVPGSDGEFAVLAGHAPVIATHRPGVLDVTAGGSKRRLFVKSGFAEVDPSRLTVLAEKAYDVDEMSSSAIAEELKSAEADLAAAKDDNAKRMAGKHRELTIGARHDDLIGVDRKQYPFG